MQQGSLARPRPSAPHRRDEGNYRRVPKVREKGRHAGQSHRGISYVREHETKQRAPCRPGRTGQRRRHGAAAFEPRPPAGPRGAQRQDPAGAGGRAALARCEIPRRAGDAPRRLAAPRRHSAAPGAEGPARRAPAGAEDQHHRAAVQHARQAV